MLCAEGCATCRQAELCTTCDTNYYMDGQKCVLECGVEKYKYIDPETGEYLCLWEDPLCQTYTVTAGSSSCV